MIKKVLRDLIFPPSLYCNSCGNVIDKTRTYGLCDKCIRKFMWIEGKTCEACGKAIPETWEQCFCNDCQSLDHYFDKGYTCATYGLRERMLVADLKEQGKGHIARNVAEIMADRMPFKEERFDLIIPVPASKESFRRRGFNQTELVAKYLSELTGITAIKDGLVRVKEIPSMKKLDAWERRQNAFGAFEVNLRIESKILNNNILVIDDVYTTGSTLDACSRALKEKGAKKVTILTFAAGGNSTKNDDKTPVVN